MRKILKTTRFSKDIQNLSSDVQKVAWRVVLLLSKNVLNKRLAIKKLEGYKGIWRVKVKKDYRLIFTFDKENLYLLRIKHRKEIYKRRID